MILIQKYIVQMTNYYRPRIVHTYRLTRDWTPCPQTPVHSFQAPHGSHFAAPEPSDPLPVTLLFTLGNRLPIVKDCDCGFGRYPHCRTPVELHALAPARAFCALAVAEAEAEAPIGWPTLPLAVA